MSKLFKKQFILHVIVLILSFGLMGIGLTKAFGRFFINQKLNLLIEQGQKISSELEKIYFFNYTKELDKEISILEKYLNASFIFVDNNSEILIVSSDIDSSWLGKKIKLKNFNDDYNSIIKTKGNLGGIFKNNVLTVIIPFKINNLNLGRVFINSPMIELTQTLQQAYKLIFIFTTLSIIFAFFLIYIFSKKTTQPLLEMTNVAKIISSGKFDKKININSNDEIGQLAISFNEMANSLNEQEKRRREFISNISHDLRSPLTSIKGFLQAIIDGTIPYQNQQKYLNIILEETERLTNLTNDIINIESLNRLNKSIFNINELIKQVIIKFETRAIEKNINFDLSFETEDMFVNADIEKIQRVMYNLIDNAIKFSHDNSSIFIKTKIKNNKTLILVKDTGIGISNQDQKRVFDRFYKTDLSRGKDKKGSGLGLSIVNDFILAHDETIEVKSCLGKGTQFSFTLEKEDQV